MVYLMKGKSLPKNLKRKRQIVESDDSSDNSCDTSVSSSGTSTNETNTVATNDSAVTIFNNTVSLQKNVM